MNLKMKIKLQIILMVLLIFFIDIFMESQILNALWEGIEALINFILLFLDDLLNNELSFINLIFLFIILGWIMVIFIGFKSKLSARYYRKVIRTIYSFVFILNIIVIRSYLRFENTSDGEWFIYIVSMLLINLYFSLMLKIARTRHSSGKRQKKTVPKDKKRSARKDSTRNRIYTLEEGTFKKGGMSVLKLAHDNISPHDQYLVKIPRHDGPNKYETCLEKLKLEAEILKRCDHPNIVKFISSYTMENEFFLIMELIKGSELDEIYNQKENINAKKATEDEIITLTINILNGLHYLHERIGYIHRDINPSNIMISNNNEVKIIDFGTIAKRESQTVNFEEGSIHWDEPKKGTIVFTQGYASPEQELYGVSHIESDFFSVGAVMYFLATGQVPQYFQRVRHMPLGPFPKIPEGIGFSKELIDIIVKATDNDPNKRYLSAFEMRTNLEKLLFRPKTQHHYPHTSPSDHLQFIPPHDRIQDQDFSPYPYPIMVMHCSSCGYEIPPHTNFCRHCGSPQNSQMVNIGPISQYSGKYTTARLDFGFSSYGIEKLRFIGTEVNNPDIITLNDPENLMDHKHLMIFKEIGKYCIMSLDPKTEFYFHNGTTFQGITKFYPEDGDWFSIGYIADENRPYFPFSFHLTNVQ